MNKSELKNRKPIWQALSNLYLDVELQTEDFKEIAAVFNESAYTIEEIRKIDLYEVFPLLQLNLLSMAGEWAGFDEDILEEECIKKWKLRKNITYRLVCNLFNSIFYWMRKDYWQKIDTELRKNEA